MAGMIEVRNLGKTFVTKDADVEALQDINLSIQAGDIYGIIGMSGAGKSTLVRCLNFLERPTGGTVEIEGRDLSMLSEKELRAQRAEIAMIFQHFNLLMQKNVIDNICFPLLYAGVGKKDGGRKGTMSRKDARKRAEELLQIVGLTEKAKAYPSQLSGGQKQRVAIARALAANPKILLCDEATSALDPQTTQSILQLLKQINKDYGITIVIITHEMSVVREICSHVAIIGGGRGAGPGVGDLFPSEDERGQRADRQGKRGGAAHTGRPPEGYDERQMLYPHRLFRELVLRAGHCQYGAAFRTADQHPAGGYQECGRYRQRRDDLKPAG